MFSRCRLASVLPARQSSLRKQNDFHCECVCVCVMCVRDCVCVFVALAFRERWLAAS